MQTTVNAANIHTRDITPFQMSSGRRWLARLIYWAIRLVTCTLRWQIHDPHGVMNELKERPVIFAAWHNRLALALPVWQRATNAKGSARRLAAIASASRDGALVAGILQMFGAEPVRGSSSRRGLHAMTELVEWARRGYDLAITPDGPRGPLYSVQPGVVPLAQLTGLPIVPMNYNLSWKIRIKSWDRFQVPLPFSRCDVHFVKPMEIPRSYRERERAAALAAIRESMLAVTKD